MHGRIWFHNGLFLRLSHDGWVTTVLVFYNTRSMGYLQCAFLLVTCDSIPLWLSAEGWWVYLWQAALTKLTWQQLHVAALRSQDYIFSWMMVLEVCHMQLGLEWSLVNQRELFVDNWSKVDVW